MQDIIHTCQHDPGAYMLAMMPNVKLARIHNFIIIKLLEALSGQYNRLMILVPPGTGKSTLVGKIFPAWHLGRWPERHILDISYSQNAADILGRGVRNLVSDPKHQIIFPNSIITQDSRAANKFGMKAGGQFHASGIYGPITGKRAHLVVIDDWVKNQIVAHSVSEQKKAFEWYKSVLYTRLIDNAIIIFTGTPWAHGDLAGRVLKEGADKYVTIKIPACATEGDMMGRRPGEWHYPERFPAEQMEQIRANVSARWWAALYQQEPVPEEGSLFKQAMFRYEKPSSEFSYIIQSWDTALEDTEAADYSAATTWGLSEGKIYLLDASRWRLKTIELYAQMLAYAARFKPDILLIEDVGSGKVMIERIARDKHLPEMTHQVPFKVEPWQPGRVDKYVRAIAVIDEFELRKVHFITKNADYEAELLAFPFGRYDDWVDTTTQALAYFRSLSSRGFAAISGPPPQSHLAFKNY